MGQEVCLVFILNWMVILCHLIGDVVPLHFTVNVCVCVCVPNPQVTPFYNVLLGSGAQS